MPNDRNTEERQARNTEERLARIEQMIAEFRDARQRELVRRGLRLWRKAEARQRIGEIDAEPERIH